MNRKAVRKLDICYSAVHSFRRSLFLPCYGPPSSTPPPLQTLPLPFSFSLNVSSTADAASSASISASALSDPMPRRRPQIPERRNRIPPPPALPRNDWEHQPRRGGAEPGPASDATRQEPPLLRVAASTFSCSARKDDCEIQKRELVGHGSGEVLGLPVGSGNDWRSELGGRRLGNLGEACISNPEASPDAFWILDSENLGAFKPSLK